MPPGDAEVRDALERPHRLGMIGGDLKEQLAHCASFSFVVDREVADPALAIDLGTGGGLPGVALAWDFPAVRWVLIDSRAGRAAEVERAVRRLRLQDRVEVVAATAQELGQPGMRREQADLVVARAFGPPSVTAECAAGLLDVGGTLVVSEPPEPGKADSSERWSVAGLAGFGLSPARLVAHQGRNFAVVTKMSPAPVDIPRLPARHDRGWP